MSSISENILGPEEKKKSHYCFFNGIKLWNMFQGGGGGTYPDYKTETNRLPHWNNACPSVVFRGGPVGDIPRIIKMSTSEKIRNFFYFLMVTKYNFPLTSPWNSIVSQTPRSCKCPSRRKKSSIPCFSWKPFERSINSL